MAEELRLEQPLGEGSTVDGHERPRAPRAVAVEGPRHELLARARLSGDEHRGARSRGQGDLLVDGQHGSAPAHEAVGRRVEGLGRRGGGNLKGTGSPRERALHDLLHLRDVDRLAHVVEGPRAHRLDGGLEGSETGEQDDLDRRVLALEGPKEVEAAAVGVQVDVRDHEVEGSRLEKGEGLLGTLRRLDLAPGSGKELAHEAAGLGVVVHHQDPRHGRPPTGHRAAAP